MYRKFLQKTEQVTMYLNEKVSMSSQTQAHSLGRNSACCLLQQKPQLGARAQGLLQPPATYLDHLQPPC